MFKIQRCQINLCSEMYLDVNENTRIIFQMGYNA